MLFDLNDEIALVTGASRGLGRAIALALGGCGARIVGTSTTDIGAETVTDTLQNNGIDGRGEKLDVTQASNVIELVNKVKNEIGPVSILINNAGITRDGLLLRMKSKDWDDVLDTNLSSLFRVTKACLRGMIRAQKGRIINVTSVVGITGNSGQTNYAAAKAGIIGFTKSLALEVASRGITANAIAPGFIETEMTDMIEENRREELISGIPLGRLGKPEDIAATVVFLASREASYITGQVIHSNGGMYMSS
jgi:3-oxoacyl-[acyl-carrier protein] reductase